MQARAARTGRLVWFILSSPIEGERLVSSCVRAAKLQLPQIAPPTRGAMHGGALVAVSLLHGVAAPAHAGGEGAIIPLATGGILLARLLLRGGALLRGAPASDCAGRAADPRTDRGGLAGVAADRAAHGAGRSAARGAAHRTPAGWHGGRRRLRRGGIEPGLVLRPLVAVELVALLLVLRLSLARVDVGVLAGERRAREDQASNGHDGESTSHGSLMLSMRAAMTPVGPIDKD